MFVFEGIKVSIQFICFFIVAISESIKSVSDLNKLLEITDSISSSAFCIFKLNISTFHIF